MTLSIGLKCRDGYVLGADGAATYGVMGQHTIRQSVKKKLRLVSTQGVVGVSGPVGIGQRLWGEIAELQRSGSFTLNEKPCKLSQAKPHEAMGLIRLLLWRIISVEL